MYPTYLLLVPRVPNFTPFRSTVRLDNAAILAIFPLIRMLNFNILKNKLCNNRDEGQLGKHWLKSNHNCKSSGSKSLSPGSYVKKLKVCNIFQRSIECLL